MIVNLYDNQSALKLPARLVKKLVKTVIANENQRCNEINVYFVDTATICQLHEQFFDDPSPTDCISFPIDIDAEEDDLSRLLGEVFVCPETALAYTQQHHGNPFIETALYLIHGLLHLMGYDDINEKDRALMREAEKRHMLLLESLFALFPRAVPSVQSSRRLKRFSDEIAEKITEDS